MKTARRAVIDVGTNSVKLLVADVAGREVVPVREQSHQTRLGKGFYETHKLQPQALSQTAQSVADYKKTARGFGCKSILVIATSAARDAKNSEDLVSAIREKANLPVRVLTGDEEADWVFRGVTTDPNLVHLPLLLLDVGGGSTEFILGKDNAQQFTTSLPIGTVRLMEQMSISNPPTDNNLAECRQWLRKFLADKLHGQLGPMINQKRLTDASTGTRAGSECETVHLVGTGGTATILGRVAAQLDRFDRERIEKARLSSSQIRRMTKELWKLSLHERKHFKGVPANRADVIIYGVAIYEAVMELFGFEALRISTRGLRFAALLDCPDKSAV